MKRLLGGLVCVAVLGIALSFIGSRSVSAKPADPNKGTGCLVLDPEAEGGYAYDANCQAHNIIKEDDEGNLEFFFYQDHGQTSWHPEETYRNSFEICYESTRYVEICGIAKETVTPSGEYKSSFKSY